MKVVRTDVHLLVRAGRELTVVEPIDWGEVAMHLERSENLVYWYQPKFGNVEDQFACVHVNGAFYHLTNKLEKAVFRNVRLTRDFSNYEMLGDGTRKLRIPLRLLREKLRASSKV